MNSTLDGLSYAAKKGSVTDPLSGEITRNSVLTGTIANRRAKPLPTNFLGASHLIRYADDFLFITLNPKGIEQGKQAIIKFLECRGLELSEYKTNIVNMKMGKKINFLGWTFHMLVPNKVNWLTDVHHSVSTRLKDRAKLVIYPVKIKLS